MVREWLSFRKARPPLGTASQPSERRLPQPVLVLLAGLLLAFSLWLAFVWRNPGERGRLEVGRPSPISVQAPETVQFVSELRTADARAVAENSPDTIIYAVNASLPLQQREQLVSLLNSLSNVRNDPSLSQMEKRQQIIQLPTATLAFTDTLAAAILGLSESGWSNVRAQTLTLYQQALDTYEYEIDAQDIERLREHWLPLWTTGMPQVQRDLVLLFTNSFLRVNRVLDDAATAAAKQAARDTIEPVLIEVQTGESLVRVGELVTPEMLETIQETNALPEQLSELALVGLALVALLLAFTMMLYLVFLEPDLVEQPRALFVVIALLSVTPLLAQVLLPFWPNHPYTFPLATVILVLAAVFNRRIALASAVLLSVAIGILMMGEGALALAITLLVGAVGAVFSVRGLERPLRFLWAGLTIAGVTALVATGFWLIDVLVPQWSDLSTIAMFTSLNGMLSALLSLGLVIGVGRVAGIVTPLQLSELAHPSQPLLRKVMREAPGTYYHSVSVGNLAESAAEAVGADALLLRVAAYYHDIGKTIRPYFFSDNQTGRENVHNELDPQTSASIIIDHVREGIKMGEEARLPASIIDFIATHHGTHVVAHFYQLALREQDTVDINEFRYPGPRPFTREQGIMMLADSVEATVRAKAQHGQLGSAGNNGQAHTSTQTIEQVVESIIQDRVQGGQLDETDLTLRDLVLIREAFISTLQGIYHPRVEYAPQMVKA